MLALLLIGALSFTLEQVGAYETLAGLLEPPKAAIPHAAAPRRRQALPVLPPPQPSASPALSEAPAFADGVPGAAPSVRGGEGEALAALLAAPWSCTLTGAGVEILILHTHTSESYRDSGASRSADPEQNVTAVGDVLTAALEALGWGVYHDTTVFDDPQYNGAYTRSGARTQALLEQYPGVRVVIDLHRDALSGSTTAYRTEDGVSCAQVMLLLTDGSDGLYHPNWQENLKLGLKLQQRLETDEPGLSRPLYLSSARYNQQLCPGSMLVEIGTDADTLDEAREAARRFAACLDRVLRQEVAAD